MKQWFSLTAAAAAVVVVGFASTILIIMQAAQAIGATPAQQASFAASLCYMMAITTFILCWRFKMPIITAWSTPGAVLVAASAGLTYQTALGAFVVAGALMVLTGLVKPLERAIERMPSAIAAAMLAGVLVGYVLKVPAAALSAPWLVVPLVIAFFSVRMIYPMYAVPVIVLLGLLIAVLSGGMGQGCCSIGLTPLTFDLPQFHLGAALGLGLPLYLVTMASQNLPGFVVLRASGYQPPVGPSLIVTGFASMIMAPFGGHAVNMAAITASLATGPDVHPDPAQRWKVAYPYAIFYVAIALAALSFVSILGALPKELIAAIAGLALFSPLMSGMLTMMKDAQDVEAAMVTFLVTASGLAMFGVGAAFWGLVAGMMVWGVKRVGRG
jgi:benzoate membrane transport protein